MTLTYYGVVIEDTPEHIKIERDNGEIIAVTRECIDEITGRNDSNLIGKHVKMMFDFGVEIWIIKDKTVMVTL